MARSRDSYHHGDLRRALEETALELVRQRGIAELSLAEVSRIAGVSASAPFRHFPNKEALLAALAERGYDMQRQVFGEAMTKADHPVDQLVAFAKAYVDFSVEHRALFDLIFAAGVDKRRYPDLAARAEAVRDLLTAPAKALRGDPDKALELVHLIAACAHGCAVFLAEGVFGAEAVGLEIARGNAGQAARALASS